MSVELKYNEEARNLILSGIQKLAKAVKSTLGPKGKNVVIEQRHTFPIITKDGVTVARAISLDNQYENLGVQMLKEVAGKTNDISGDGTTTATVLAEAIYKEGVKHLTSGSNAMELKTGIDLAVQIVVHKLKSLAKEVSEKSEIAQVATVAANGDIEIGEHISDAMEKVGKEGIVTIEESRTTDTTVDIVEGMQFDSGFLSPYFVTDAVKQSVTLDDCYVLVYEKRITDIQKFVLILNKVLEQNKPLLIIADDLDTLVLQTLVINKLQGKLNSCAVKAPLFGVYRKAMLQDIATLTGGLAITEDLGIPIEKITLENLGKAKKVIITKDSTTIIEGAGDEKKVADRITLIREQIATESVSFVQEKLQERLAKLVGGVAVISIGATTESELKEKKYRIEDALQATRAAIEEGIVPGGGTALVRCVAALDEMYSLAVKAEKSTPDELAGMKIIKTAIQEPIRQIALNAGIEGTIVLEKVKANTEAYDNYGYNARTGVYEDLVKAGVIDPVKVTRVALENAASVAGLLLTTNTAIIEKKEKENQGNNGMPIPGMM